MKLVFLTLFICVSPSFSISDHKLPVQTLVPGEQKRCCEQEPFASNRDIPVIYCFEGLTKGVLKTWLAITVETQLTSENYELYEGIDSEEVWQKFEAHRSSWTLNWFNWLKKSIILNPFNSSCFGIQTYQDYELVLHISDFDCLSFAFFWIGILLFYFAPALSDNAIFYYVASVAIGMFTSVAIVVYFIVKLLPLKKPVAAFTVLAGGATAATFLSQFLLDNIYMILFSYQKYVIAYLGFSALVSVIVYYRFGPITDRRSKTIIKYSLEVVASVVIYNSSFNKEFLTVIIIILTFISNLSIMYWIYPIINLCKRVRLSRKHVTPRKLLTKEEYDRQGIVETERALRELRAYSKSPEFQGKWEVICRLKKPKRYFNFINGSPHIPRNEFLAYVNAKTNSGFDRLLPDDAAFDE